MSPLAHAELIDDVFDRGELRIALEANTPPFNFKEGDKLTGFEVELGELLAKEMDVRASFITTDDTDLLLGVESGKYDVAINHIAMTPELQDRFDFSEPYSYSNAQLIVRKQKSARWAALKRSRARHWAWRKAASLSNRHAPLKVLIYVVIPMRNNRSKTWPTNRLMRPSVIVC